MDHSNLLLPQDIKAVPLERARVVRPGAVGDAFRGVAYQAALAQFVSAAAALWTSTVSARLKAAASGVFLGAADGIFRMKLSS